MERKIIIQNFGPIKTAEIDLDKNFQVFIGEQASGKSTIGKMVYYCYKIRDYTVDFLMDEEQFTKNHENEYFTYYLKYLRQRFMDCFGTTRHMPSFQVWFIWGDDYIYIYRGKDGYVWLRMNEVLERHLQRIIKETADIYIHPLNDERGSSIIDKIFAASRLKQNLQKAVFDIFGTTEEVICIPAGRSLLATLSEDLGALSTKSMDLTMREFVALIKNTRKRFGTKIPEIVKDYTKTINGQINNVAVEQAYSLMKKILKADYTSEEESERIYFDDKHWVKLMYGSSGQQEVLWILLLVFVIILEQKKAFLVVEEPEAHLFPKAQRNIINLIALLVNSTGSKVLLTTHSPYILTSSNVLLYSGKVEGKRKSSIDSVIPKVFRLSYEKTAAYIVGTEGRTVVSLMDEETHMIDADYIDSVSEITNEELERLLELENNL